MFQRSKNYVLKWATLKGMNMLPFGSMFFTLIVAPKRIEITLKGIKLRNRKN